MHALCLPPIRFDIHHHRSNHPIDYHKLQHIQLALHNKCLARLVALHFTSVCHSLGHSLASRLASLFQGYFRDFQSFQSHADPSILPHKIFSSDIQEIWLFSEWEYSCVREWLHWMTDQMFNYFTFLTVNQNNATLSLFTTANQEAISLFLCLARSQLKRRRHSV